MYNLQILIADFFFMNVLSLSTCSRKFYNIQNNSLISSSKPDSNRMRFVQYLRKNDTTPKLGAISDDGATLTDLSSQSGIPSDMITFIKENISVEDVAKKLTVLPSEKVNDNITLLPPVLNPEKIICIGLNYSGHCLEQNKQPPKEPMFFSKFNTALVGPTGNVIAHAITKV